MGTTSHTDNASVIRGYLNLGEDEQIITRQRFSELSKDLGITPEELDNIFVLLDTDNDDVITLDELLVHWNRPGTPLDQDHGQDENNCSFAFSGVESDGEREDNGVGTNQEDFLRQNQQTFGVEKSSRPKTLRFADNSDSNRHDALHNYSDNISTQIPFDFDSGRRNSVWDETIDKEGNSYTSERHGSRHMSRNGDYPEGGPRRGRRSSSCDNQFMTPKARERLQDIADERSGSMEYLNTTTATIRKMRTKSPRPSSVRKLNNGTRSAPSTPCAPLAELTPLSPPSQEQVCELYQNLHSVDKPELVSQFESILLNVINDVRQFQLENERLEKTYRREKDEHDKHLRRLEEEMEQQVQSVEERVRKQEKEKLDLEKIELRNQLDSEIIMLQQNLNKLQQDGGKHLDKGQEEHLLNLKKRLEEIQTENRVLKSDLTNAQTNLALIRSQMSSVKQQLDEKNYELEVESKTIEDYMNEQDKLRRQLQMLHEANKTLLDTNDNLREVLDAVSSGSPGYKRAASTDFELGALYKSGASARSLSPNIPRKGSIMSDYVSTHPGNTPSLYHSLEDGMMPRFLRDSKECIIEDLGDIPVLLSPDSGHSTLRDMNDINEDTEIDSVSVQSDKRKSRRHKRPRGNLRVTEEGGNSHEDTDSEGELLVSPDTGSFRLTDHKRSPSVGSRGSNRSQRSLTRDESVFSQSSKSSRGSSLRRQLPAVPSRDTALGSRVSSEPERMYKIVLAGDAAVGKSSFIVRLCKGKFVPNLSSTLGVDFQTKMLDVDSQPTALQLWDTAGQERFRSVARTYFRRADGVLLLYDVTYERSFLNLRDWVDAIEDGATKKIPIMLVGNKTDARPELEYQGRRVVKYEDGVRLSREIESLFIETSAKDGANITEAVIELTRLLRTNEDLEVKTVGMQLHEMDKKSSSCCKRS